MRLSMCGLGLLFLTPGFSQTSENLPIQNFENTVDEIVVTSDFVEQSVLTIPTSVTVLHQDLIEKRSAEHLSDLIGLAPNVNYASGGSRGRFFQIRGIGERSQFVDPINPGIGLLVDGMDFSGIGNGASLFDIRQVEILRGPQGSRYGANALGGLITLQSNSPSKEFEGQLTGSVGGISENSGGLDSWDLGLVLSGPLSQTLLGRIAVEQYESDGNVDNTFLNRDDTNGVDQTTVRSRLDWQASRDLSLDFALLYVNADNGYDAFSLDNNRDTISDQPGRDLQKSLAFSVAADYQISDTLTLQIAGTQVGSDIEYSFDEDWAFTGICDGTGDPCDTEFWGFSWEYSGFDQYVRSRNTATIDARLLGELKDQGTWVFGVYAKDQDVDLARQETFNGAFQSAYASTNVAMYGQFDRSLGPRWGLSLGARIEQFDADYIDSNGIRFKPDDFSWGGHIALEYFFDDNTLIYTRVARGYKAGGANSAGSAVLSQVSPDLLAYETETLLNYEFGIKGNWLDKRLSTRFAVFYQDREDAQIRQSFVDCSTIPCVFTDYVDNAAQASASGMEAEVNWFATDRLELFLSVGLLQAEFDDYLSFSHVNADANTATPFNLNGRALAQSPEYQATVGADIQITERWGLWLALETQDKYFFSNRHEAKADAFQLFNAKLSYHANNWSLSLWGNNLTNEVYLTRGFGSFPNDPRNFYADSGPYVQFGDAREIGVSASYRF